jgi:5-methyltetrahydrofolate--homocysteine methyltransferase
LSNLSLSEKEVVLDRLRDMIVNFNLKGVQATCRDAISLGISPGEIVSEGLGRGLAIVGERYEKQEFFLSELVMAGETMKKAMEVLDPVISGAEGLSVGNVVIGTVKGDLHDIGKNIVSTLLRAAGFRVRDLGVDVPAAQFVKECQTAGRCILGMSALLSVSMPEIGNVVTELEKAGLRGHTQIIIGGAAVTEEFGREAKVDATARDAVLGVEICKSWSRK